MGKKVEVECSVDNARLPGELVDKAKFADENSKVLAEGGEPSTASIVILGITRASLYTESVLSAASFQETTSVLRDAAISGKIDYLRGLKENVIIGRLIPTGERARLGKSTKEKEVEKSVIAAEEMKIKEVKVKASRSTK